MLPSSIIKIKYIILALIAPILHQGAGDKSNSLSILKYIDYNIKREFKINTESEEIDIYDIEKRLETIKNDKNNKYIIITTGIDPINKLIELKATLNSLKNINIILSIHQYSKSIESAIEIADIISIPSHAITADQISQINLKSRYAEAIGASTNITKQDINNNYLRLKSEFENFTGLDKAAVMFFGGDATIPNSSEKKLLTIDSAKQMGKFIADNMKNSSIYKIIITDGPRTGAHLGRKDGEINPVIESFINILKNENIETLYKPFIIDVNKRDSEPSAYRALLNSGFGKYYYSEESISTGFEMAVYINSMKGKAIGVESSSTQEDHKLFAKQLKDMGYISVAEMNDSEKYELKSSLNIPKQPMDVNINNENIFRALKEILFKFRDSL